MNLLRWLRRLGILRFGAESAVYGNAGERPLSIQQDDIFNSKEDALELKCCTGEHTTTKHSGQTNSTK